MGDVSAEVRAKAGALADIIVGELLSDLGAAIRVASMLGYSKDQVVKIVGYMYDVVKGEVDPNDPAQLPELF